jgi:lipopolysaccharide export system permease protein
MLGRLSFYLFRQMALASIAVVAVLSVVIWLTQSLRFIDWIVNRGLPVHTFVWIAGLILPMFLAVILPIALFAAITFTFQKLQADSEVTVMRAVGVGPLRMIAPALAIAVIGTALGFAINLHLLPASYREFKLVQAQVRSAHTAVLLQEGVFTEIDEAVTVFVEAQGGIGDLRGIMVQDARDPVRPVTIIADQGTIIATATGPRIVLRNGNRQELNRDTGRVSFLFFERYSIDVERRLASEVARELSATERFLGELWNPEPDTPPATRAKYLAEGHQRLVSPFYNFTFVVIGLAALTVGAVPRNAPLARILLAVGLVAAVQAAGIGLMNLSARLPDLIALMYVNAILPGLIGLGLILNGLPRLAAVPRLAPPARPVAQAG